MKFAVLFSMLAMSVLTWGQSPTIPPNYVATPIGWLNPACVYDVAVNQSTDGLNIYAADGSVVFSVPPCPFPSIQNGPADPTADFPAVTGTVTDGQRDDTPGFSFLKGKWTVPVRPDRNGPIIFIFPGIEDPQGNFIIQPVLQYGFDSTTGGGGAFWGIASLGCSFSNCFRNSSGVQRVDVGHEIEGKLDGSNCGSSGCFWVITATDKTNGASTQLNFQARQPYPFAFVALEFEGAGLTHCDQLPEQNGMTVQTELKDHTGAVVQGAWHPNTFSSECGFGTTSSDGSSVTLLWHP